MQDGCQKMDKSEKKVAALKYKQGDEAAPRLAAKGKGFLAEKILEIAKEHKIPIRKDADLVEVLEKLEVDQEIPLEIFAVVAEIFAYIYKTNQQKPE